MAEAGVPRQHISAVLNHVEGGASVTREYDRYTYDAEKRRALETWARNLRDCQAIGARKVAAIRIGRALEGSSNDVTEPAVENVI